MTRYEASRMLDQLVTTGLGESLWVDKDEHGWYIQVIESRDRLPLNKDFRINGVRVKVDSSQPAIPQACVV